MKKILILSVLLSLALFISGCASSDSEVSSLKEQISELEEENRQLREILAQQGIETDIETSQPEPQKPEADDPEPQIKFIGIGEITSFAEWDYKVLDVEIHKTLDKYRSRGQYIVFLIEVKNNAKTERQVSRLFQAEDDQGRVFSMDADASLGHHHAFKTDAWYLDRIGASLSAIVPIAFDIPEDAETLYLYPADIRDEEFKDTAVIMYTINE